MKEKLLKQLRLLESVVTKHIKDRLLNRLNAAWTGTNLIDNPDKSATVFTNFVNEKPEIKQIVYDRIQFLSKINFPHQDNIGIMIFKGGMVYKYDNNTGAKPEHSEGKFIWVIARGNDLETIVFGLDGYRPKETQIHLNITKMMDYVNQIKKGNFNLTPQDLINLQKPMASNIPKPKEENTNELLFNHNGANWILQKKEQLVFQKNKPTNKMNAFDFIESIDDEALQEKLLMAL